MFKYMALVSAILAVVLVALGLDDGTWKGWASSAMGWFLVYYYQE